MTKTKDELLFLKAHNPIPEKPDSGWPGTAEGRALLERIEARVAPLPTPGKRPRWRRPSVTIPVFVALSASALLFASAVAGDKVVSVSAQDALTNPSGVERQLADEGIQARVEAVPVKESLVGKWFHLYLDPTAKVDAETLALLKSYVGEIDYRYESVAKHCGPTGGECERTSTLEIPGSVTGPITLVVGRAAEPAEQYWARNMDWSNELAPSGAFYCMALEENSPEAARDALQALGYDVELGYDLRDQSHQVDVIPPGTAVTTASSVDAGTVALNLAPIEEQPGYSSADQQRLIMGTPTEESGRPDFGICQ